MIMWKGCAIMQIVLGIVFQMFSKILFSLKDSIWNPKSIPFSMSSTFGLPLPTVVPISIRVSLESLFSSVGYSTSTSLLLVIL